MERGERRERERVGRGRKGRRDVRKRVERDSGTHGQWGANSSNELWVHRT